MVSHLSNETSRLVLCVHGPVEFTLNPQIALSRRKLMGDEPPSLAVGTGVSAKYKGAFCEAKIRKVVRSVKCKVLFKNGLGSFTIGDDQIKGLIRTGAVVEAKHPEKKEFSEATITRIQDCSQYTVVFDDGDITTLRRTALCLKSGKHFAESETLDQLPLTHPEHFSTPVIGGRRGRRSKIGASEASSDEEGSYHPSSDFSNFKETDIGRVVCVEGGEKRKNRDNWFPGLIVAPTAQESGQGKIRVRDEYLIRSFKDGRYYTVPKKETTEFSRELGTKAETNSVKTAVEKALQFIDRDELPLHWDRDLLLYGATDAGSDSDPGDDNESSDDEPREKKDHFVAQLYKFMDENGTPINEEPVIGSKDVDLFRLYKAVHHLGGFNRVTNQNHWKNISVKLGFGQNHIVVGLVKQCYKKYLLSFEEWPKRPGSTMQIQPRLSRSRVGRGNNLKDRSCPSPAIKVEKEKSAENPVSNVSEPPSTPSTSKSVIVQLKEPAAVKPLPTPVTKEKPNTKKTPQLSTSSTPPVKSSSETIAKLPVKGIKVEPRPKLRNPKHKNADPDVVVVKQELKVEKIEESDANEPSTSVVKEKKKKVVPRVQKKAVPVVKGAKVDCLANSRQKRVIKDRLKTVPDDSNKARSKPPVCSVDVTEKVAASKTKVKDESNVAAKTNKKEKEDTCLPACTSDGKKKKRKRKEKSETSEENQEDAVPKVKAISLGDKLKVFYGPTKEAEVTSYDAKVLSTKEENGEPLYYVHYLGWNVRYDEWIGANRIAEVLGAGRSPKKQTQSPTTPKPGKREKRSSKTETCKPDNKPSGSKEPSGAITSTTSVKEHNQNRQGSVGRSTTPCSVASSSGRSKGPAQKRPKTRATQLKKGEDSAEEYESDAGSDGDEQKIEAHDLQDKPEEEAQIGRPEQSEDEDPEREDPEAGAGIESDEPEVVSGSSNQLKAKEGQSEPIVVKAEVEEEEEDEEEQDEEQEEVEEKADVQVIDYDDEGDEHDNKDYDEEYLELLLQNSVKEEYCDNDSLGTGTPLGFDVPSSETGFKDTNSQSAEEFSTERFPSESETSDTGLEGCVAEDSLPVEVNQEAEHEVFKVVKSEPSDGEISQEPKTPEPPSATSEIEAEDVYEFKEPEPFEFEARKSEDKGKGTKRTLCSISMEGKPSSPKYKKIAVSPAQDTSSKASYQSPSDLLSKDDNSPESTPTIQTCEEAFDKMCASPLRAATLDSCGTALLDNIENYEDADNFDDDSEDRLVISERDSDNGSNASSETGADELVKATVEHSHDSQPEWLDKEESKDKFEEQEEDQEEEEEEEEEEDDDEDDDEAEEVDEEEEVEDDEEEEDEEGVEIEALKSTEQVESSDDLSEVEPQQTTSENIPVAEVQLSQTDDNEADSQKPENENITPVDKDVESKPEVAETEAEATDKAVEDDVANEPDDDVSTEEVINAGQDTEKAEEGNDEKEDKAPDEGDTGETVDAEEDENNLESLICEETIPGSPPSHLEALCQLEDKTLLRNEDVGMFKSDSDLVPKPTLSSQENKHVVEVAITGRSPSTTPESNESPTPSPSRESVTSLVQNEKQSEKDPVKEAVLTAEPSSSKKETGKASSDGRSKKVEPKTPAKRGRKSKKKSEDANTSTKRKYGRHSKHQGSESDDGYDPSGGNKSDSSSSRPVNPYRKNFLIPPDELATMDTSQQILRVTQAMQDLRTAYNNHKAELAAIDKRRKRIRRREREEAARGKLPEGGRNSKFVG